MNAKENALRIIRFEGPAYVMPKPPVYALYYYGCNHEGFAGGSDHDPVGSKWVDIWGTGWHKMQEGVMGLPEGNPLADVGNLATYQWPDPDDERLCSLIYDMAKDFPGGEWFLGGSHRDTLWEKAYMLVGMENMMMYFLMEPDFAREVLRRIMDFHLGIAQHYVKLGVEFVQLSDDLGSQHGALLGPRIVEQFLVPEYERLISFYIRQGVLVGFHSCGNVASVIDVLMQLGVDVLNPIQATANDLDEIRRRTEGCMALQGGVNSATILDGPIDKIVEETRQRLWQLGQGGGYFCCQDQEMPFPQPHIAALHQAVAAFGQYPLQPLAQ